MTICSGLPADIISDHVSAELSSKVVSRRGVLKILGVTGMAAGLTALPALPAIASTLPESRVQLGGESRDVILFNTNTRETIDTVFYAHGRYNEQSFNQLCHFMRDSHENVAHWMDPRLLTMLYDIQTIFDKRQIQIISGYRTPRTNARLSRSIRGVGKNSFHMKGQAVDIRIPGVEPHHVRDVAKILQVGGVGYYPRGRFVHIDTGPVRTWNR